MAKDSALKNPEVSHEESEIDVRVILWFAGGMVVFAVVLLVGMAWMYFLFLDAERREKKSAYPLRQEENGRALPDRPRLEALDREHSHGQGRVSTAEDVEHYKWIDREKGVVAIPIDQAFDRLLKSPDLKSRPAPRGERGPR